MQKALVMTMTSKEVPVVSFEINDFPSTNAVSGDVLILTKPLGTHVVSTAKRWLSEDTNKKQRLMMLFSEKEIHDLIDLAKQCMVRSNSTALKLMQKYNIHAAMQLSCLGLLKDAKNLAQTQNEPVDFIIYNFPVISKALQRIFWAFEDDSSLQILKGNSPEISGGLLISMSREDAMSFCADIYTAEGYKSYIIGLVEDGNRDAKIVQVPTLVYEDLKS